MDNPAIPQTTAPRQRLLCFICGNGTTDAADYLRVEITTENSPAQQWFGAHASCLNAAMAQGFHTDLHLM